MLLRCPPLKLESTIYFFRPQSPYIYMKYTLLLSQPCLGPQVTLLRPVMARISLVPLVLPRPAGTGLHGTCVRYKSLPFSLTRKLYHSPLSLRLRHHFHQYSWVLALAINCQDSSTAALDRHAEACVFLSKTSQGLFSAPVWLVQRLVSKSPSLGRRLSTN